MIQEESYLKVADNTCLLYTSTSRAYCQRQVDALWDEVKRFENPHNYYVDLSQKLWDIKQGLLNSHEMK